MIGWRARIGVIYPADGVLDDEFRRCVPEGVTVHVTRSLLPDMDPPERNIRMAESRDLEEAAKLFTVIKPSCIAYACTAASFIRGVGYDTEIIRRIEDVSGTRATTTSTAVVEALKELEIGKLAVVAPYVDEVCLRLKHFLQDSGFEVVSLETLGLAKDIFKASPGEVYQLVKAADRSDADALFISCTNLRALEIIDALEQDIGKPIVNANQATMWHALRLSKIHGQLNGLGCLYRSF
jgi:maleate isomerase